MTDDTAPWDGDTAPTPILPVGGSMGRRRFWVALAVIVAAGLGVRVAYVLMVTRHENNKIYDALWYGFTGLGLSLHQFFRVPPGHGAQCRPSPTHLPPSGTVELPLRLP